VFSVGGVADEGGGCSCGAVHPAVFRSLMRREEAVIIL
jgi:hypothetical protein